MNSKNKFILQIYFTNELKKQNASEPTTHGMVLDAWAFSFFGLPSKSPSP